jgi:hypothetical protein
MKKLALRVTLHAMLRHASHPLVSRMLQSLQAGLELVGIGPDQKAAQADIQEMPGSTKHPYDVIGCHSLKR